jgi:phosphatidylinositol-bisphosphatase
MEDEAPIPIWEGLIHHTLNNKMQVFNADNPLLSYREPPIPSQCDVCSHHVPEVSGTNSLLKTVRNEEDELSALLPPEHHSSNSTILHHEQAQINCLTSKQNMSGLENETSHLHPREDSTLIEWSAGATMEDDKESTSFAPSVSSPCRHNQFLRIVSKQMVGIFITIWIRSDLWHHVHDIKVCSVGCGIFNYLGNKVGFFWEEGSELGC